MTVESNTELNKADVSLSPSFESDRAKEMLFVSHDCFLCHSSWLISGTTNRPMLREGNKRGRQWLLRLERTTTLFERNLSFQISHSDQWGGSGNLSYCKAPGVCNGQLAEMDFWQKAAHSGTASVKEHRELHFTGSDSLSVWCNIAYADHQRLSRVSGTRFSKPCQEIPGIWDLLHANDVA